MKNYKQILEAINRGIKFALDDFEDSELQGQTNSKVKYQNGTKEYLDLMKEVVDLGLPSGTLWCKYNLGCDYDLLNNYPEVTNPRKWYGKYYAWGETMVKKYYEPNTYKHMNTKCESINDLTYNIKYNSCNDGLIKYCYIGRDNINYGYKGYTDNLTLLLLEDDAAYLNMHVRNYKFHIPTKKLCEELVKYTIITPLKNYKHINGLNGWEFTSIKNNNSIFIPASGICFSKNPCRVNKTAVIWSSTISDYIPLWAFGINMHMELIGASEKITISELERSIGFNIRPVINL